MKKSRKKVVVIALLAAILTSTATPMMHIPSQITLAATTQKGTATKKLDVYTGPNGQKIVRNGTYLVVEKGTTVNIGGERDGYYYITFQHNGATERGWVLKSGVKIIVTATPAPTPTTTPIVNNNATDEKTTNVTVSNLSISAKCTAESLRVRKGAGLDKKQLEINGEKVVLTLNQKMTILKEKVLDGKVWYYVKFKHTDSTKRKGYVLSDYVKISVSSSAPVAAKMNCISKVKIRKKAGVNSAVLKVSGKEVSLKNGKSVKIIGETVANSKKWFKIKFSYKDATRRGYLLANTVVFKGKAVSTATPKPTETVTPKPTETTTPTAAVEPTATITPVPTPSGTSAGAVTTPVPTKTPVPTEMPSTQTSPTIAPTSTPGGTTTVEVRKGIVNTNYLNVRVAPGVSQNKLQYNGKSVQLMKGDVTTILEEKSVDGSFWYHVSFLYNGVVLKGYVSGLYVDVKVEYENINTSQSGYTALSKEEFEKAMVAENFPESYKEALRALHEQYPLWQFKADHTGLKWDNVIKKESVLGKNLISNNKSIAWKSLESGTYDWATDTFKVYDGTSWVAPSKEALQYYMDPRNFLNPSSMFQFQILSYDAAYQTASGVDNVLKNTPMYQTSYSYKESGKKVTYTYADTFIKAAEYSGVNPYHLATRVKQEVVTSKTTMSNSVSGKVSGYKGIYNFYNIGATHSTVAGGNIANGLHFAKNGTGNTTNDALFLIAWDNRYKAIVGGAKYIGKNYINRGQDTVYLQKFNVTDNNTYNHQYMANIEAPNAESIKTYHAYSGMTEIPVVFSIPVYKDMPEEPCEAPSGGKNPNNWLKKLSVSGYTMTPAFDVKNDINQEYTITVSESVSSIQINATAVSTLASVTGSGTIALNEGRNTIQVAVEAESGDIRNYVIYIERE